MKKKLLFGSLLLLLIGNTNIANAQGKSAPASNPAVDYQAAIDKAYEKNKNLKEGKNADYIKELANVDPNIYGIAIVTLDGKVYTKGDLNSRVSIQSISKVFTLAKVIDESGAKM